MSTQNILSAAIQKTTLQAKDLSTKLFKENVDVGTAIVSVLSNFGIAGFKFHCPQTEQIKMQSDVTDNYIDTNRPVQDHVALKPVTISLTGLQGEYFYSANQIEDMLAKVTPVLPLVKQFLPKLTTITEQIKFGKKNINQNLQGAAYATSFDKDLTFNDKFRTAWNTFNGEDLFKEFQDIFKLKSAQTRAFLFFQAMWQSRARFSIETTWRRYDNMVITDVIPMRDNNADITEFTVNFKQINYAMTLTTDVNSAVGRTKQQLSKIISKGLDKGKEVKTI